jgi:integrase/recombinase XerC
VELAQGVLDEEWTSTDQRSRVAGILQSFVRFCVTGLGIVDLADVTPVLAERFIRAASSAGDDPSLQLQHLRRTALRLLFRSVRCAGEPVGDPTLDLVLPQRPGRSTRALTDEEITLCRGSALWSLTDSRRAAAWALAEGTCRTGELPFIRVTDVDQAAGRVWLHGGRRTTPRWGYLTDWGQTQIERRLTSIGSDHEVRLVYQGSNSREGGRVSSSLALLDVLRRAGLADEPGVRPSSIAAWAGRQILAETGRIDVVAQRLGLTRLDTAADFIGWNWREDSLD